MSGLKWRRELLLLLLIHHLLLQSPTDSDLIRQLDLTRESTIDVLILENVYTENERTG